MTERKEKKKTSTTMWEHCVDIASIPLINDHFGQTSLLSRPSPTSIVATASIPVKNLLDSLFMDKTSVLGYVVFTLEAFLPNAFAAGNRAVMQPPTTMDRFPVAIELVSP